MPHLAPRISHVTRTAPGIRRGQVGPRWSGTEILERDHILGALEARFAEATRGSGRLAFLGGEAGVGKTTVARLLADRTGGRARVAWGACDFLSTPRPLGPLLDVADVLGPPLTEVLEAEAPRHRIFRDGLAALSRTATLVVFEDVHWADEATLDLLRFLGRRLHQSRALMVVTYRDDEVGPRHPLRTLLGDLATAPAVSRVSLSPLSEGAVRRLAQGSGLDAGDLYRRTGGNPFFVTEVLASGSPGVPATVRDAILARVSRLSPAARAVLDAAAVIGVRVETEILGQAAPPSPQDVDECLALGLLRPGDGGTLIFRHELTRQAVLDALSPHQRTTLHRAVLAAMAASPEPGRDPARLAHHAEAAGDREAVLTHARAAARAAASAGAHREAAAQYARVLRFADPLPPAERAELLEAHAREASYTDLAGAIAASEEAVALWQTVADRSREGALRAWMALQQVRAGRTVEGEQTIQAALGLLEALPPAPELAQACRIRAHILMLDRRSDEAIAWGERAIALAESFKSVETLVGAYGTVGSSLLVSGEAERGRVYLERGIELARQAGLDGEVAVAYANLGSGFGEFYDFAQADRYLKEGIAFCLEHDNDTVRHYMESWLALSHLFQGRWDDAVATALPLVSSAAGTIIFRRIMALIALGRVRTRRGDPEATAVLDEALTLAEQTGTLQRLAPVRAARAEAAWLAGNARRSAAEAAAAYDLAVSRRHPWFVGELAYWRWRAGEPGFVPPETPTPFGLQVAGQWRQAAGEWERRGCPYEMARALTESDDERALRQALAGFEQLGARPMAALTARRLRQMGIRGIPRGPRPSTRARPGGLTEREAEVLQLMADGMHNAEIAARLHLSAKTVDHHVSSVLTKLGARTRVEAVRAGERLGLIPAAADRASDGSGGSR